MLHLDALQLEETFGKVLQTGFFEQQCNRLSRQTERRDVVPKKKSWFYFQNSLHQDQIWYGWKRFWRFTVRKWPVQSGSKSWTLHLQKFSRNTTPFFKKLRTLHCWWMGFARKNCLHCSHLPPIPLAALRTGQTRNMTCSQNTTRLNQWTSAVKQKARQLWSHSLLQGFVFGLLSRPPRLIQSAQYEENTEIV